MTKETLKTFINKYYLGGTIESVKWVANTSNKQLITNAITEDKNVLLKVTLNNFSELEDGELGINDTSKLVKLLGVLKDEIKAEYNKTGDKLTSVLFSDETTDVQYVIADLSVIPSAPPLKKVPPFTVEIPLDTDFIINAAGYTGSPNVDACEIYRQECIDGNVGERVREPRHPEKRPGLGGRRPVRIRDRCGCGFIAGGAGGVVRVFFQPESQGELGD